MAGVARHSQALCAAEAKVAGCTIKESGFGSLFLLVDGLSVVDIITLFVAAALGLAASCTDAWLSSVQAAAPELRRLRRLMGPGQWIVVVVARGALKSDRSLRALVPDMGK